MLKVYTSTSDLDALASALDKARKNATMVSVPRQALANLVCDTREVFTFADKNGGLMNKGDA